MDVVSFLDKRIRFILTLHEKGGEAFELEKRLIDEQRPPYDNPPYSEDGEPPFLEQWMDAENSIAVLGGVCITMLSEALKGYFKCHLALLGIKPTKKVFKKRGFFRGNEIVWENAFKIRFSESGADLKIIEEVIHLRNFIRHQDDIVFDQPILSSEYKNLVPSSYFVHPSDQQNWDDLPNDESLVGLTLVPAHLSKEKITTASEEISKLCNWIDQRMRSRPWLG